jgi:FlaA1/EpsC-like NDP-sugar epimerase
MVVDAALIALAYFLAFAARLEQIEPPFGLTILVTLIFIVPVKIMILHYYGAYRSIWRYSGLSDLERLVRGCFVSCLAVVALAFMLPQGLSVPRSVPFVDAALMLVLLGGARFSVRVAHESQGLRTGSGRVTLDWSWLRQNAYSRRTLVVGAGDAGEMIVREMLRRPAMEYEPVAFVDDDPRKYGHSIHGVPVMGSREKIPELVADLGIKEILIAIPSTRRGTIREIVQLCKNTKAGLKTLPDLNSIVDGTVSLSDLKKVDVEDLLGREPAELDLSMISAYLRGKRILVTGAGGSIGSELCRQILRFAPAELQLMGRGENSIYEIHRELSQDAGFTRLVQVVGDVINKRKFQGVFAMHKPQIVFHAGADKHVPLMELNPDEAVLNNIVGTKNVLEVANDYGVERVVCISTDKAVNPSSVMGCCKRVAELLVQSDQYQKTVAVAVRFGNVLGSRGSVIPLFQRQIEAGGPVTVTHRGIRRYFMTIPEAAGLVIQAGAMGSGGEIFVLDMGQPVKIWDLAHNMIRLAGREPGTDIEVKEVGLRRGEKMDEELALGTEACQPTTHPKITCVRGAGVDIDRLIAGIRDLHGASLRMDYAEIRRLLKTLVPEYQHRPVGEVIRLPLAVGNE